MPRVQSRQGFTGLVEVSLRQGWTIFSNPRLFSGNEKLAVSDLPSSAAGVSENSTVWPREASLTQ